MKKHSNCECHTESNHTCQCDKVESHSCHSDCSCASSGAPKSEYNNQWASPAGVKAEVEECCKGKKKEKTATNNQWC